MNNAADQPVGPAVAVPLIDRCAARFICETCEWDRGEERLLRGLRARWWHEQERDRAVVADLVGGAAEQVVGSVVALDADHEQVGVPRVGVLQSSVAGSPRTRRVVTFSPAARSGSVQSSSSCARRRFRIGPLSTWRTRAPRVRREVRRVRRSRGRRARRRARPPGASRSLNLGFRRAQARSSSRRAQRGGRVRAHLPHPSQGYRRTRSVLVQRRPNPTMLPAPTMTRPPSTSA